jgi:thioredoxin 1
MSDTATIHTAAGAAGAAAAPREVEEHELQALLRPERLTVVDFSATWCGPCRRLEPILGELAAELPTVDFFKLDADRSQQLAMHWGVQAVPTILVLRDGRVVDRMVGLRSKGELAERLRELDRSA